MSSYNTPHDVPRPLGKRLIAGLFGAALAFTGTAALTTAAYAADITYVDKVSVDFSIGPHAEDGSVFMLPSDEFKLVVTESPDNPNECGLPTPNSKEFIPQPDINTIFFEHFPITTFGPPNRKITCNYTLTQINTLPSYWLALKNPFTFFVDITYRDDGHWYKYDVGTYDDFPLAFVCNFRNVTYDAAGGSPTPPRTMAVYGRPIASAPSPAPAKAGYDFDKWVKSDGTEFVFGRDTITADMTLTATYTPHAGSNPSSQDPNFPNPVTVNEARAGGSTRVETAMAAFSFAKVKTNAVLATGNDFPDALVGGTLAGALKTGIYLTTSPTLEKSVLDSAKSYGVKKLYILGGTGAISATKEQTLKNAGFEVQRIGGADRYETADMIKSLTRQKLGLKLADKAPVNYQAIGNNYPDALGAAAAASRLGGTIDLVKPGEHVTADTHATKNYCTGGPACANARGVSKLVGKDRYETVYKIMETTPKTTTIMVATGKNYPDTLVGGALASSLDADLYLYNGTQANVDKDANRALLLGGTGVVPNDVPLFSK